MELWHECSGTDQVVELCDRIEQEYVGTLHLSNIPKEHPYLKVIVPFCFTEIYHRALSPRNQRFQWNLAKEASSILRGPIFHFCACWRNKPMEFPIFPSFSFESGGFSILNVDMS